MIPIMDTRDRTMRKREMRNSAVISSCLAVLLLACVWTCRAQLEQSPGLLQEGRVANYRFAEQGELSITVCLVGAVRFPGRYEISRSIDILNLLALAGGWNEDADLSDVRVNRLTGTSGQSSQQTLKLNLTNFQELSRTYLTLQHGDYIYIGTKSGVTTQEVISWVTAAAVLVTAWITVSNQSK
jgi:hypothetical protein